MTPAEYLEARYAEEQTAAEALADPDWGTRPWAVTECSDTDLDHAHLGCPCIVYQGEYKPVNQPQVPGIRYIADAETPEEAAHIATWDPARILAEVEMKRAILATHAPYEFDGEVYDFAGEAYCGVCGDVPQVVLPCSTVLALLRPYRARPDFDLEWQ